jgi:hypothetical protein
MYSARRTDCECHRNYQIVVAPFPPYSVGRLIRGSTARPKRRQLRSQELCMRLFGGNLESVGLQRQLERHDQIALRHQRGSVVRPLF